MTGVVETASTCTCDPPWPQLRADVPGRDLVAVASATPGPLCALWTAQLHRLRSNLRRSLATPAW
jgi:hypothetical protein